MIGRDPHEERRVATPLELLFDLIFVIGFGNAASQLSHAIAEGHSGTGLLGFLLAMFAVCWAWVNYSWFSSAYDTDDWLFRLATLAQMVGVAVLSLGLPRMFAFLEAGEHLGNGVMVLGYVIMRAAMVLLWLRAAREDVAHRTACLVYAVTITIAQIGWVALLFSNVPFATTFLIALVLTAIELSGPVLAESRNEGTPWHAHHIAERYSLLVIIALGEIVTGTVASASAVVETSGWSANVIAVCAAGLGLAFGMWWIYFILPSAAILHKFRKRVFVWSYGHLFLFIAIAAVGAGVHVAAYSIEHKTQIGPVEVILSTALPLALYVFSVFGLYAWLVRAKDLFHLGLLVATVLVLFCSVAMAFAGVESIACLEVLTLAPVVTIIGYEVVGYRHARASISKELGSDVE